ncbi:translation initiation factor 2, partial [Bacteroides ovatus]
WMECEHCHQAVQILAYAKTKPIPVYTGRELAEKFLMSTK